MVLAGFGVFQELVGFKEGLHSRLIARSLVFSCSVVGDLRSLRREEQMLMASIPSAYLGWESWNPVSVVSIRTPHCTKLSLSQSPHLKRS